MKKRNLKILSITILLVLILTSCNFSDTKSLNETYKPTLKAVPINGIWEITEVVRSESRYSFPKGEKFYFDMELFATSSKIYLNPNFEIIKVDWERYLSEYDVIEDLAKFFDEDQITVIEIKKEGLIVAELIPLNDDEMLVNISNQTLFLERKTDIITEAEKSEIKLYYSEREKVYKAGDSWGLALGIRSRINIPDSETIDYDYNTLLFRYSKRGLRVDVLDGILINNDGKFDFYDVGEINEDNFNVNRIYLNDDLIPILDHDENYQSPHYRINYLSPQYLTLEYLFPGKKDLNKLSTYSTDTKDGLVQLKIDDIVSYNNDRVLDAISNANSEVRFSDAVYNIGFNRENGLTVLKGRVISSADGKLFNKDYIISSSLYSSDFKSSRRVNYGEYKSIFPDMIDALSTPIENQLIVINKDSIDIYTVNKNLRDFVRIYRRDLERDNLVISHSWFNQRDLNNLETTLTKYGFN